MATAAAREATEAQAEADYVGMRMARAPRGS